MTLACIVFRMYLIDAWSLRKGVRSSTSDIKWVKRIWKFKKKKKENKGMKTIISSLWGLWSSLATKAGRSRHSRYRGSWTQVQRTGSTSSKYRLRWISWVHLVGSTTIHSSSWDWHIRHRLHSSSTRCSHKVCIDTFFWIPFDKYNIRYFLGKDLI